MNELKLPAPLQTVNHPVTEKYGVQLSVLRIDLIHPYIGGNKWYKLKYNLKEAKKQGLDTLLTFGGAYSNHILATAIAGKIFGFKTIGVIRGEEYNRLNPVLQMVTENGMTLKYINREQYKGKTNEAFIKSLHSEFGNFYLIPEGGANELGVKGSEEILPPVTEPFDVVCCACGTGTTLAGIVRSLKPNQKAIGFPVLKNGEFMVEEVQKFVSKNITNWSLQTGYHFGGYGKSPKELEDFISAFYHQTTIPLDTVYTGKLLYGIMELVQQGYFPNGAKIVAINSGNKVANFG